MSETVIQQLYSFLIFFISGVIIGIFFDIFRIIRKIFKVSNIHTYIEDIIFGLITGFFLIFITFIYNNGNIRFYMFIAIFLGILLYLKLLSKHFIKINVTIFGFINQVIYKLIKIIMYPIKCIFKLF